MESREEDTPKHGSSYELEARSIDVVDMFDQANTAGTIECLGVRGDLLKGAIDSLRRVLNQDEKKTLLSQEQVEPRH